MSHRAKQLTELTELKLLKAGDMLIDRKTLHKYPVTGVDYDKGNFRFRSHDGRTIKRALGQFIRVQHKFIILRKGHKLEQEYSFYCPKKNKIIILEAGTVFLGEL